MNRNLYPVLKRNYNLRVSKGRMLYKDFRTGNCGPLENGSFAFLQMCNGQYTVEELESAYRQAVSTGASEARALLKRYAHLLTFSETPAPAPQLEHVRAMLEPRGTAWPYNALREETPFHLEISLTEYCNHRCLYCYQGEEHHSLPEIGADLWRDVISQAARLGVQELVFTGGEPTLYPSFFELVEWAAACGMYPTISTNGSTLSTAAIERLHRAGAEYIHLSMPALSPEVYGRITGAPQSLETVKQAIRELKQKGFYLRVKTVLTSENTDEAYSMIRFCGEQGVDCIHLAPFIASTKTPQMQALIPSEASLRRIRELAGRLEDAYPELLIAKPPLSLWEWRDEREIVCCGGVKESLTILNNGDVTFCEPLAQVEGFLLGNIRNQTLSDIWNSPVPDRYYDRRRVKEPCVSCAHLPTCRTGCFLFSHMANGDAFSVDPRCFRYAGQRIGSAEKGEVLK